MTKPRMRDQRTGSGSAESSADHSTSVAGLPGDEPIRVVPDWVCESLSKNRWRHDLLVKLPYYAMIGVAYAWLVDLEVRVLTAHRLESGAWRIEPFDVVPPQRRRLVASGRG